MSDLDKALLDISKNICGTGTMRIKGREIDTIEVLELYYTLGSKRKFSLNCWQEREGKREWILEISEDVLTQWQTVTYYHTIAKTKFENNRYLSFFSDLNLLISKDLSRIGDFHESSALLQVPDLPYEYVEHISYFVEEDGSYSQEINNIITYVKDNLEKGFYVVVELDQYFVNPVLNGHRALRHLVYGYNDIKKQFYCRGFVDKKFSSYKMDYHDFAMAYEYSKIVNVKAPVFLELYKPKAAYSEIEKEKTIEEGLYRYFKGKNTYAVLQDEEKNVRWQNCEEYVGHIASERFIWLLELVIAGKAELCYQCVHAFYENKLMLFERGIYSFGKKGYELIEKVVYYANLARYHYIKYEITRNKVEIMSCYKLCQKCIEVEKAYFQLHFE